ncbi:class I SAM-dependent methyltransferase, partial [Dickeya dianthicola]
MRIGLLTEAGADPEALAILAQRWGLENDAGASLTLVLTPERLELRKGDEPKLGAICVDFAAGAMAHRRR